MTDPEFEITISWNTTHVALNCSGGLDLATQRRFREAVELSLSKRPHTMLLDLTDVTFFGSEGLRSLLQVVGECVELETELAIRMSEPIAKVVEMAGVKELIAAAAQAEGQEEPVLASGSGSLS